MFEGLAVSLNEISPVLNWGFPEILGSGRLNVPLILPAAFVTRASPKIKLASLVENPFSGLVNAETSCLSKNG